MHYNSIRFSDCWCNRTGDTTGYKFHSINCSNKNYEIYSNNISTYFRKLDPISYNTAWLRYKFYVNNYVCYMPILSYELNREKVTTSYFKEFVEITVSDQGPGIPPDMVSTIFERFQQVSDSTHNSKGGTGLGLTICKEIVNMHGGKIWVTNGKEKGSVFHFTLPCA